MQTGVCACVSLEVERVVETLAADGAQVALDGVVAAQMAGEQSLQWKHLAADPARPLIGSRRQHCTHTQLSLASLRGRLIEYQLRLG